MIKFLKLILLSTLILPILSLAEAKSPRSTVETAIDQIIDIVNVKEFPTKESRHDAIYDVVDTVFDFEEMSKRSLGANWKTCTEAEQSEFIDTFSEFLARTYIDRIDEIRDGMVTVNDEKIRGNKALVKTKIKLKEEIFPIDYKMLNKGDSWEVYDVIIENVGLISNYRNEFAGIIRKEKFSGLIAKLKEKNSQRS